MVSGAPGTTITSAALERGLPRAARICAAASLVILIPSSVCAQRLVPLGSADAWQRHAQFDAGQLPASTPLQNVTLVLQPSRLAALQQFLSDVQNPLSPRYHHWLTPEEFRARFGASESSLAQVRSWLRSAGVTSATVARGGLWIRFSANAGTLDALFHTELHRLSTADRQHYANAVSAAIPVELSSIISGVSGLDNFDPEPQTVRPSSYLNTSSLGPADLADIYGLRSLYDRNITGNGMSIAIVGRTPIPQEDVRAYRATFGLPQKDFQSVAVPHSTGINAAVDEQEGTFDLEVAAGAAPAADLVYVWGSTVDAAAEWAIDSDLASILSESYAGCENTGDVLYQTLALQAAAEGITWISAAGDSGAAGCDAAGAAAATNGLHASAPASTPGVVAVGGSALTPSGETGWSSATSVTAGGGGVSAVFGKPGYQSDFTQGSSAGRMLPDVAFAASPDASPYSLVFNGHTEFVGGTSLAAPLFAGILALLNQSLITDGAMKASGLGAIDPILYRLSEITPDVFHDIASGTNDVPCDRASPNCAGSSLGYPALSGYDLATGLGSIDASALAHNWSAATFESSSLTLTSAPAPIHAEQVATLNALVTSRGSPLADAPVQFYLTNPTWQPNQILLATIPSNSNGVAGLSTDALPSGNNIIEAIATGTTSVSAAPPETTTIQVTGLPTTVNVTTPQSTYTMGQSVQLPVTVTVAAGASFTGPADAISCITGTVALNTATGLQVGEPVAIAANGAAILTTPPLASGDNSYFVSYSGNCYAAASRSAQFSILAAPANPPDFSLSSPTPIVLASGGTATLSMTVQPLNGFNQPVQFTCALSSPAAHCSIPNQLMVSGAVSLPITISAPSTSFQGTAFFAGLILVLVRRRRNTRLLALLLLAPILMSLTSCGSSPTTTPSDSTFNVTVTATSGSLVHSVVIPVTVGK